MFYEYWIIRPEREKRTVILLTFSKKNDLRRDLFIQQAIPSNIYYNNK